MKPIMALALKEKNQERKLQTALQRKADQSLGINKESVPISAQQR